MGVVHSPNGLYVHRACAFTPQGHLFAFFPFPPGPLDISSRPRVMAPAGELLHDGHIIIPNKAAPISISNDDSPSLISAVSYGKVHVATPREETTFLYGRRPRCRDSAHMGNFRQRYVGLSRARRRSSPGPRWARRRKKRSLLLHMSFVGNFQGSGVKISNAVSRNCSEQPSSVLETTIAQHAFIVLSWDLASLVLAATCRRAGDSHLGEGQARCVWTTVAKGG